MLATLGLPKNMGLERVGMSGKFWLHLGFGAECIGFGPRGLGLRVDGFRFGKNA